MDLETADRSFFYALVAITVIVIAPFNVPGLLDEDLYVRQDVGIKKVPMESSITPTGNEIIEIVSGQEN